MKKCGDSPMGYPLDLSLELDDRYRAYSLLEQTLNRTVSNGSKNAT